MMSFVAVKFKWSISKLLNQFFLKIRGVTFLISRIVIFIIIKKCISRRTTRLPLLM